MAKKQKNQIDSFYNMNGKKATNKNKEKERIKRIKTKNNNSANKFDFDNEVVIGMTNKNNQRKMQEYKKIVNKKQVKIEKKKKLFKNLIKWISLFIIIIAGIVFLLVSPIFNIKEIEVINNSMISSDTIISLSGLQVNQNLFKFRNTKVKKMIKANPYIEDVNIKRKMPNKVEISVKERERNFNVEFLNEYFYINNQGYILEISEEKLELPVIQGISTEEEQIVVGKRLNNQDLEKLEVVIEIMNIFKTYEMDNKVSSIDISDKNNYIVYMEQEKKTIHLGDGSNLSNKMLYVVTIINQNSGKEGIVYLDGDINNNFKPRFKEKV